MKTTKRILMSLIAVVSMVTGLFLFAPKATEVQAASVKSGILEELMNVKMQLKKNANASYDVRMVFGIDNLEDYQAVGFEVYYNNAKKPIVVRSTKVRTNLDAISNGYQYKYSPKAISVEAEYFAVATIKGVNANKTDKLFYVVPFVEMKDEKGTIQYGAGRCFSVNDGLAEDYVNMTLPTDNALSANDKIDVTLAGETVSATVLKKVDGYVFVNVDLPSSGLKAVSKVTYDGKMTYYRNHYTAATPSNTADTSWYDVYDADTTKEYVIGTKEELYGLATLVNNGTSMEGKTIYQVSDISVNKESMNPDDYADGAWATAEEEFVKWIPIGGGNGTKSDDVAKQFAGSFDGQGHTISGLYMKRGGYYLGLFGLLELNGKSTIKNLKLTNSYFERTAATAEPTVKIDGLGSIAGLGTGTLENIYSDAILINRQRNTGGLVGTVSNHYAGTANLSVANCCYEGSATGTQYVGGIIGYVYPDGNPAATTNITDCLVNAELTSTLTTANAAYIGGIAGTMKNGTISSCVVNGTIVTPATENYPAGIVRSVYGVSTLDKIYYSMDWKGQLLKGNFYTGAGGTVTQTDLSNVSDNALKGQNAYKYTKLNFYEEKWNEDGTWVAMKEDGFLQLKSFADKNQIDGLTNVARGTTTTITADTSWYNDSDNEFTINTAEALYGLAKLCNEGNTFEGKTIKLGKDIVVNKTSMDPSDYAGDAWATAEEEFVKWIPIGGGNGTKSDDVAKQFAGSFDGQGHTISGLYMKRGGYYLGLFGLLELNGKSTIKNLKLTNSYFERTAATAEPTVKIDGLGSIAGLGTGTLENIYSDAILINRQRNTGGLVGTVSNHYAGTANLSVANCCYEGSATGTQYVGGIIGYVYPDGNPAATTNITDCLVNAELTSTLTTANAAYIGGIAGTMKNGTISSCVVNGTIVTPATENYPAGIVRSVYGVSTLDKIYYSMDWKGQLLKGNFYTGAGGTVTQTDLSNVSDNALKGQNAYKYTKLDFYKEKWNEDGTWAAMKEDGFLQLKSFADKDQIDGLTNVTRSTSITADTSWYNTTDTEFTINTAEALYGLAELCNGGNTFEGKTIQLGKDIVVNKASMNPADYTDAEWETATANFAQWIPIGGGSNSLTFANQFAGTFDGQGHTISGLYMKRGGYYLGLFGILDTDGKSTIQNLKLTNSYFERTDEFGQPSAQVDGLGSIAGLGFGKFDTIYSDATLINAYRDTGGLIGIVTNYNGGSGTLSVNNCWFNGSATGTYYTGGILGYAYSSVSKVDIKDCLVTADLKGTDTTKNVYGKVGGLCGNSVAGTIESCITAGTLAADYSCGGLIGTPATNTTVKNCFTTMKQGNGLKQAYIEGTPTTSDNVQMVNAESLQGLSGYSVYLNKLDFYDEIYNPDGKWVLIKNRLPELRSFTRTAFETKPVDGLSDFAAVKQDGAKTVADYENYIAELESTGYKLYASNEGSDLVPYVRTATYKKGEEVVTVSYVNKTSELYVSSGENVSLSKHLKPESATTTAYTNGERTTMYMTELYNYGDSFIIQLKNGHFIVIDGGMTADALYLIKDLVELAGDKKPVIEAWFISHGDSDHAGPLMRFADFIDQSSYADKIIVEGIYYNVPYYNPDDSNSLAYLNQLHTILIGASKCKTSSGAMTKVYRPQIGQKYYFDDITVDVMYTHEQLESSVWTADANEASTWLRLTIDDKTFLHTGDALQHSISGFTGVYDSEFLDFDVVTTPHHAQHITDDFLNNVIKENKTKVLYTTFITDTQTKYYSDEENEALRTKVGEGNYICWGNGTVVVTFNEGVTWTTQDSRDWTWHPDRNNNPPTQYIGNPFN